MPIRNSINNAMIAPSNLPGTFPNATYPAGYTNNSIIGNNDLYTVPAGRKALIVDFLITNATAGTVAFYAQVKIGGTYYTFANIKTEATLGIGHYYGISNINQSSPIVLNAGETVSMNVDSVGLTIWASIIEYDDTGLLSRATLTSFVSGANTLLTVPVGKTVCFGTYNFSAANQPIASLNGIVYRNSSGSTVTMNSINLVPSGGSPANNNLWATTNSVPNNTGFTKYMSGNLNPGDYVSIDVNSAAAGQLCYLNYMFV